MEHLVTKTFAERLRAEYDGMIARGLTANAARTSLARSWCSNRRLLASLLGADVAGR